MGSFMNFAGSSAGQAAGGIASSLISSIASSITANRQNRKNREFQAKQAQLARDWQEDMYNKYSSPSAMVKQYQEAGLNPALALGGQGQTFTGTSGMTSGSQMMPDYSGLDLSGIFTALAGLNIEGKKADASIERDKSEANYFDKLAEGQAIDNETKPEYNRETINSIKQGISESLNRISNDDKRVENEVNHVNGILSQIEKSNEVSDARIREINANIRKINTSADLDEKQKVYYAAQITYLWALSNNLYSEKGYTDTKKVEQEFVNNYLQQNGVYPRAEELTRYRQKYLILGSGIELDTPGPAR